MASFEVLYHPDMEPPQRWLRAWALFFDCIHSLVPHESRDHISPELQEFASANPGVYDPLEPPPGSNIVPDIDLVRFDRNLQVIAETRHEPEKIEIEIQDASVRIRNHTFLHNVKLSGPIKNLLRKHKLMIPDLGELYMSGYEVVQEDAADVILSYICKRAAKERGWSTLTDCELPFAVVASEDLRPRSRAEAVDALTAAVMSIEVPWDVQHMDLGSYKTLRDAYADLRQPFQTFMHALTDLHRLEGMDEPHLREKVRSIALEFDSRVQLFRNTRFAKKIPKWLPVGIGGFATLAGTAIKSPSVSIPCAVIRVTISVLQELRSSFKPSAIGERESLEMMANLQDAMLVNPTIFRLAGR